MLMKPKSVDSIDGFIKNDKYIYEQKEDGGSCLIKKHGNDIQIFHGSNPNLQNYKYPDLINEIHKNIKDGEYICELCVLKDGYSHFPYYLKRQLENKVKIQFIKDLYPVVAVMHDIVKQGDNDVTDTALLNRKKLLKENIKQGKHIQLIEMHKTPDKLLELKDKIEGIVIKDINSFYKFDKRDGWFKFRFNIEETVKCEKYEDTETGIVLITTDGRRINCAGSKRSEFAKKLIREKGGVLIEVSYHEKTDGGFRFPVCKRILD